jgi:hypothetical protein
MYNNEKRRRRRELHANGNSIQNPEYSSLHMIILRE